MKRSKHSLTHYKLASLNMGMLTPIACMEVLPGDTFQMATSALIRVSPLLAPVMHPVHVRIHHWFVPNRLIWEDWEDFITGGSDGGATPPTAPTINMTYTAGPPETGNNRLGWLPDYFGIPPQINNFPVSALPFRAYNLIYNEWYRDQDLAAERVVSLASGVDTTTSIGAVPHISWEKDYFTSARPWSQKGPQVTVPLSGNGFVDGIGKVNQNFINTPQAAFESDGTNPTYAKWQGIGAAADNAFIVEGRTSGGTDYPNVRIRTDQLAADVNDLRLAMALQRWAEARAKFGSRYTEYLRYYGVRSSDARLQRPEYLGGGKQTIQFSEVLQTAPDPADADVGVGNLKGHGIGAVRSNRFRRFFEEHGFVISLVSIKPRTMYLQGVPRMWSRATKEDYFTRELQHIGQQEVFNRELYATHATPGGIFGYQDRYDEYRRMESTVNGEFRTTNLNYWHMARTFASEPVLNEAFVVSNPTDRIFAIPPSTADTLWCMFHHSVQARRMVAKEGTSFIY